jgi:hypothetical protein
MSSVAIQSAFHGFILAIYSQKGRELFQDDSARFPGVSQTALKVT